MYGNGQGTPRRGSPQVSLVSPRGLPRPSPPPSLRSPRLAPLSARSSSAAKRSSSNSSRTALRNGEGAVESSSSNAGVVTDSGSKSVGFAPPKGKALMQYLLPERAKTSDATRAARGEGGLLIGSIIPEGPYKVGDCIIHELLDENGVWQWRLGKLLWVDETNERVGYTLPFVPPNKAGYSPDVSKSTSILPLLSEDKREIAVDALAALSRAKEMALARQKELSELSALLHKEEGDLTRMSREIGKELEDVLPLLENAREAVGSINPVDLSEMRSYRTPPPIVMRVLEAVKTILEDTVPKSEVKWKEVTQYCKSNDFVPKVRDFESELSKGTYAHLNAAFIQDSAFSAEAATRASAAAGPLFQWIVAQISAAEVRTRIAPLLRRHETLSEQASENAKKRFDVLSNQKRVFDDVRNATRAYQRAVFGFDFLAMRGARATNNSCDNTNISSPILVAAGAPFRGFLEELGLASWEPSTVDSPSQMLMSTIMARLHV